MLEYFEGTMFLTSNRAEDFDEAFLSRIHLKVTLPELGTRQRTEIWKGLVNHRRSATNASAWRPEMFESLGKLEVNVRPSAILHNLHVLNRELTTPFIDRVGKSRTCSAQLCSTLARVGSPWPLSTSAMLYRWSCRTRSTRQLPLTLYGS